MSFFGVHMDANEFGEYIMQIRDKVLSRLAMAEKSGWHVNTIKGYEKEGRLPDIDYLAALALETSHSFSDLVNKRLLAGKLGKAVEEQHLLVSESGAAYEVKQDPLSVSIAVLGAEQSMVIDRNLLPDNVDQSKLVLLDARSSAENLAKVFIADTSNPVIQDGQLFLIDIGNGVVVRRIQYGLGGSVVLTSENSTIPPLTVTREQIEDIIFIGKVVSAISYF